MFDDFDEYIVRFKYCSEYRNVYIKKDELTLNKLLDHGKCISFTKCFDFRKIIFKRFVLFFIDIVLEIFTKFSICHVNLNRNEKKLTIT